MTPYLSPADEFILSAVWRYHYLTNEQLLRLRGLDNLGWMQKLTRSLQRRGYLLKLKWPPAGHGSLPLVYALGTEGRKHLRSLGYELSRFKPSEELVLSWYHTQHLLDVNDVLIAGELLGRSTASVRLVAMMHDKDLRREPIITELGGVAPDGWLDFAFADGTHSCVVLEVDRSREAQKQFRAKVACLWAMLLGPYQQRFKTDLISIAVVVPDESRVGQVLDWIELELEVRNAQDAGALFFVTAADPVLLTPASFYCGGHWWQPFTRSRVALLEL